MDIKKIKSIIELIKNSGIAEIEITEGEEKLRISTTSHHSLNPQYSVGQLVTPHTMAASHHHNITMTNNAKDITAKDSVDINELVIPENYITSPMVGSFYRASSPSSSPFVEVGQEIKIGQVLCIIEAMKLMNQIESDRNGIIKDILVKDGAPVEFGQPLFVVE